MFYTWNILKRDVFILSCIHTNVYTYIHGHRVEDFVPDTYSRKEIPFYSYIHAYIHSFI